MINPEKYRSSGFSVIVSVVLMCKCVLLDGQEDGG